MAAASALLSAGVAFVCLTASVDDNSPLPDGTDRVVAVELVSPALSPDGYVEWTDKVPFVARWVVTNHGPVPIHGAFAGANCQCRVIRGFPKTLQVGESTEVAIRITPPLGGKTVRGVPLLVQGNPKPIATLEVKVHVPVTAPQWLVPPSPVSIQTVVGQRHVREVVLDSVEVSGHSLRIRDAVSRDPGVCDVTIESEQRPWGDDGKYLLRKYRLLLTPKVQNAGKQQTVLSLTTDDPEEKISVPVTVEAMPALFVAPTVVDLTAGSDRKLTVVPRIPDFGEIVAEFDPEVVQIEKTRHESGAESIVVRRASESRDVTNSEIVFHGSNHGNAVRVPVVLVAKD